MVFVGMGLNGRCTQVAVLDNDGDEVTNLNLVNGSAEFAELVAGLPPHTRWRLRLVRLADLVNEAASLRQRCSPLR